MIIQREISKFVYRRKDRAEVLLVALKQIEIFLAATIRNKVPGTLNREQAEDIAGQVMEVLAPTRMRKAA